MKKIFTFLLMLSLLVGIERNILGQIWQPCSTAPAPNTVPFNTNLVSSKSHWLYFGQIWHGELLMNNTNSIFTTLMNNNVKYSIRHYDNNNLNTKFNDIKQQLSNFGTDLTNLNTANGTINDISFWNARMSAGNGGLGENMLIGFVRDNAGTKECIYVTKKWKDIPSFSGEMLLSDRTAIGTTNKAYVVIQKSSTQCINTPVVNAIPSNLVISTSQNHILFGNFSNPTTNVTLQYTQCGPNDPSSVQSTTISKNASVSPIAVGSVTAQGCNNGLQKVQLSFTGGTGVYEMHQPGTKTYFPADNNNNLPAVSINEVFTLVSSGVFGKDHLWLAPGTQTIKVRDAQNYDSVTGMTAPGSYGLNGGDAAMYNLLKNMQNTSSNSVSLSINVPACTITPTITTNTNSVNFSSTAASQNVAVTGANLTGNWSAISNTTWITISGSGQNGVNNLTLNASANTSATPRNGTVTISGGGATAVTISVSQAGAVTPSPCYRFNIASFASSTPPDLRPITLVGNVLNLNSAGDNTNNSIWKVEDVGGGYLKMVSATNINTAITIENGIAALNNIVNVATYTGASSQKWLINQDAYNNNYLRSSLDNNLFIGGDIGAYNGGDTDPNTKDLKLKNNVNWGGNKWKMVSITCPATTPNCTFTLSNNTQSGGAGTSLVLNPQCSGADCGSVTYSWSGNNQTGSNLSITLPSTAGTYTYTVTGTKTGCPNQTSTITVTVNPASTCNPVTSITSGGVYKFRKVDPNTTQFVRPNATNSNILEFSSADNNNTYRLDTDGSGYKMTNIASNKIIEIQNGSTSAGGYAVLISNNPNSISDHQRFQFELVGNSFKIKPVSVASWNWGLVMETWSGALGTIRQYGYSNPVADHEKYNVCQVSGSGARISAVDASESEEKQGIFIAPNPVNNILHYYYISDAESDEIQLQIFDMIGRSIKSLKQQKTGRITKGEISVESIMQGTYILNATDGIKKDAKRFIKE